MKKIIFLIITIILPIYVSAQFSAGIRESTYVYGRYTTKANLAITLEHSLYSEKAGFQRIELGVGYGTVLPYGFKWEIGVAGGTTWNRNYQIVTGYIGAGYSYKRFNIAATINPRYDSGLDYMTCWRGNASLLISRPISVLLHYTTIPQYRMSEKRIGGGFEFRVSQLSVKPELSFSVDEATRFKNMRVLMSMNYDF